MFIAWIYGAKERRGSVAPYSLFSQKKKKKKICGSGTTYTRASVGVVHTKINVTGSLLVWGIE